MIGPIITTWNEEALPTQSGHKLQHYKDIVKSLMKIFAIKDFPNCTNVRKAREITLSGMSSKEDMALLSEHMTHSAKVKNSQSFVPCYSPVLALTIGASLLPFQILRNSGCSNDTNAILCQYTVPMSMLCCTVLLHIPPMA